MDAERDTRPIEPGPEPDTSTAAEGERSDPSLDGDDQPME
ncbi:hypothetical protein SAMN04487848_3028 [Microbacterium sp. ru370.1]|nr:hypothetical protein SAMN04487848_3028 [Microbacterium sp. ru370.1]SIT91995.1 hypothetical protein SAMN05880579_2551 [Microbacterium sp. RU1D]